MYLSRANKFLYVAVPRTASNTTQALLTSLVPPTGDDLVFNLHPKTPPYSKAELQHYHATPPLIIENNWMQPSDFDTYTSFGFVRDPVERWVSTFFLARSTGRLMSNKGNVELMQEILDGDITWPVGHEPIPTRVKKLLPGPVQFTWRRMVDFFHLGGKQVVDAYPWQDFREVVGDVTGNTVTDTEWVDLNRAGIPDEFRQPPEKWLSSAYALKLRERLRDDYDFYEKQKR